MPLLISDDHKRQLTLLLSQDTAVVSEFCRLASLFLKQEVNPRVYVSAANKLAVQPSQVEEAIQALSFLLSQSARASASQTEFKELTSSIGFSNDAADVITNTYIDNEIVLKEYLKRMGVQVPHYKNLEWRFDILVGSRTLHHIAEPVVTMQLSLERSPSQDASTQDYPQCATEKESKSMYDNVLLQTDANNLIHMTTVLEEALQEARTHHSRRIQRHFK